MGTGRRPLWKIGYLSEQEVTDVLSQHYRVPTIELESHEVVRETLDLLSMELCERLAVVPVSKTARALIVAMVDPTDEEALDALRRVVGSEIEPVMATERAIRRAIRRHYNRLI